ncbi:MAG TPA: hypothetical protein VE057_22565 [Archangium sp.]|nr:hypothetical protein [Archangium sp.]
MRMNVVELAKRKGGPSALRLMALLSLVLGACTSRQTSPTQQADVGQAGVGYCNQYLPSSADIQVQQGDAGYTYTIQYTYSDGGTSTDNSLAVKVQCGGTLNLKGSSSDGGDINFCFTATGFTAANSSPFSDGGTKIKVSSTGKDKKLINQPATYTYAPCTSGSDGGTVPEIDRDEALEGASGTLEVGTGGGGDWEEEVKRSGAR